MCIVCRPTKPHQRVTRCLLGSVRSRLETCRDAFLLLAAETRLATQTIHCSTFGSLLMSQTMTPKTTCTCPIAGMCERHQIKKNTGWWKLCQTNQGFVDSWDAGIGPGQDTEQRQPTIIIQRAKTAEIWLRLHKFAPENAANWDARTARRWYCRVWLPTVPRYGCKCQEHWRELTKKFPPDFSSPKAFFEWGWARHNDVSITHSKKPTITLEQAYAMYWAI